MKYKSSTSRLQISPALTDCVCSTTDGVPKTVVTYLYKDRVETQRGIPADTSKV